MSGEDTTNSFVAIWVAISVVAAALVGVGTGVLWWLAGKVVAEAVVLGFVAFGGTLTLALLLLGAFRRHK